MNGGKKLNRYKMSDSTRLKNVSVVPRSYLHAKRMCHPVTPSENRGKINQQTLTARLQRVDR